MTKTIDPKWGAQGKAIYERTYSRKIDGVSETWEDTVRRVTAGNLTLSPKFDEVPLARHMDEMRDLNELIGNFGLIPAGRHLWATGVDGKQYLYNCHFAGWDKSDPARHFSFLFMRLMEGGGVGSNYSSKNTRQYGAPRNPIRVHITCDEDHADYADIEPHMADEDFVDPMVQNYLTVSDSREGWADALETVIRSAWDAEAASDIIIDLSDVRPSGSELRTFGGTASGPAPLAKALRDIGAILEELWASQRPMSPMDAMAMDHAIAQCVVSGGVRRSARMSILPWDDPWIEEFITSKQDFNQHWTTNISVAVDQEFFWQLFKSYPQAEKIVNQIAEGMYANGEPGIVNLDRHQWGELAPISGTNPCGEQTLEDWEGCNLGHINLDFFAPTPERGEFDLEGAIKAARLMTRFLIRATFGDITDPIQKEVMDRNRRIGVGLTGFASMAAKLGVRYADIPMSVQIDNILMTLRDAVDDEAERYSRFLGIPKPIKLTTIAPTGTISKMAGVSEGAHPIYARHFLRRIRFSNLRDSENDQVAYYQSQGYKVMNDLYALNTSVVEIPTEDQLLSETRELGIPDEVVQDASDLDIHDQLAVQQMLQNIWSDNAVSYTVGFNPNTTTVDEIAIAIENWGKDLKGTTLMPRDNSRPMAPYQAITEAQYEMLASRFGSEIGDATDEECSSGVCPVR